MLELSGLPYEAFKTSNVIIDSKNNYIRTLEIGDPSK